MLIPFIFLSGEYDRMDEFVGMWRSSGTLRYNIIMSGLTFYLYNEVSTLALKSISGVTHSVANTAKRAIIIVGCAIAFGEPMAPIRLSAPGATRFARAGRVTAFVQRRNRVRRRFKGQSWPICWGHLRGRIHHIEVGLQVPFRLLRNLDVFGQQIERRH